MVKISYSAYAHKFQLLPDESQGVSKHKVWQIKEEKLRAAREAISMGGLKTIQKY